MRWPVGKVRGHGDVWTYGNPGEVAAELHEPDILLANEIERQEAHRSISEAGEERLGAAALHVSTPDGGFSPDFHRRGIFELDAEYTVALLVGRRRDDRVLEAQRPAVEAGDDSCLAWLSARAAVRGLLPQIELFLMTARAGVGAREVLEARLRLRERASRWRQWRKIGGVKFGDGDVKSAGQDGES
jgi:hypothetical protein